MAKVLIVDDAPLVRERLKAMLGELDDIETVAEAQDQPEALNSIRELNPDVVILDIRMPRGNGIDVLQSIKKHNSFPLVIMLTNYPYPQYQKKCLEAGADFFFDKSTEFDRIPVVLKKLTQDSQGSPKNQDKIKEQLIEKAARGAD